MRDFTKLTFEECCIEIRKYKTLDEFKENCPHILNQILKFVDEEFFVTNRKHINKFWNKENVYIAAMMCSSKRNFKIKFYRAYSLSKQNNWFDNYIWFIISKNKPNNYWKIEENCRKEALKYKSKKDFRENSSAAYTAACRYGYIKDYDWLLNRHKPNNYWTKERCREESKKYKNRTDFRLNCRIAYEKSQSKGWLEDFGFKKEEKIELTKEECIELASICSNKTEFHKYWNYAFHYAQRHNWLEEISTYFRKTKGRTSSKHYSTSYVIYAYIDNINHYAYIGLTKNLEYRKLQHKYPNEYGKFDSVSSYFIKNDIPMPEPIILYSNLNSNEASQKEIDAYYEYKENGWNMINSESALGSLGTGVIKWTKENLEKEAKKYNTIQEFRRNANYAYYKAKEYGLLDKFNWLEDIPKQKLPGFWTEEQCKIAALKCKSKKEFEEKYPSAYDKSLKKGWLNQYDWFIHIRNKNEYWTENVCKDAALKCTTHKEFRTKYPSAYNKAKKMKWLSSYTWLKYLQLPKDYWNKERCKNCALQCKTWKEFYKKFTNVYNIAKRHNWLKDYTWLEYTTKPCCYWTKERCQECALKCETIQQFKKEYNGAYRAARNKKWLKDYYWLKDTRNHWTKELCRKLAELCENRNDFNKKFSKAYRASYNNKWLDEFFK